MLLRKIILVIKFMQFKIQRVDIKFSIFSNIGCSADIQNNGSALKIGKIYVRENVSITTSENGKIDIGDNTFFNRNCIVASRKEIKIGSNCIFGPNVCIYDHDHTYGAEGVQNGYNCDNVIIEENCWIGAGAIILKGTHIKKNSIIAAGAIVKGSFDSNSLIYSKNEICCRSL